MMNQEVRPLTDRRLKTPRTAAGAGILFGVLLITANVLIRLSLPPDPVDGGMWLEEQSNTVALALSLVPIAGIAFLWFIGVLRDRIGAYEDRFFAAVFFGSGLLFLAMLFAFSAVAGGIMMVYGALPGQLMESGIYTFGRTVAYQIMNVYAVKMAGVFMITTCTLAIRIGIFLRWMAFLGYGLALLLLLISAYLSWTLLVFPLWVLLISVHILLANLKPKLASGL